MRLCTPTPGPRVPAFPPQRPQLPARSPLGHPPAYPPPRHDANTPQQDSLGRLDFDRHSGADRGPGPTQHRAGRTALCDTSGGLLASLPLVQGQRARGRWGGVEPPVLVNRLSGAGERGAEKLKVRPGAEGDHRKWRRLLFRPELWRPWLSGNSQIRLPLTPSDGPKGVCRHARCSQ